MSYEMNCSSPGLPHTPKSLPPQVLGMKAHAVYCITSLATWVLLSLSIFLLVLSVPGTIRILAWTDHLRVLLFCFGHVTYLAKSSEIGSVGVCSCPAARLAGWIRHWSCCPSYRSVLPMLSGSELQEVQTSSSSHPSLFVSERVCYWFWEAESDISPLPSCCSVRAAGKMAFVWLLEKSAQQLPGESGCKWNPYATLLSATTCWKEVDNKYSHLLLWTL